MSAAGTTRRVLSAVALSVTGALVLSGSADAGTSWTRPPGPRRLWVKVTGSVRGVGPAEVGRLDARLDNHHTSWVLLVDTLTVTITGIDAKHRRCGLENFAVVPYSGPLPLVVPPRKALRLSDLDIPVAQRPGVTLVDRPWNQNPCLGAKLTIIYGGSARFDTEGGSHDGHDDDPDDD